MPQTIQVGTILVKESPLMPELLVNVLNL